MVMTKVKSFNQYYGMGHVALRACAAVVIWSNNELRSIKTQ